MRRPMMMMRRDGKEENLNNCNANSSLASVFITLFLRNKNHIKVHESDFFTIVHHAARRRRDDLFYEQWDEMRNENMTERNFKKKTSSSFLLEIFFLIFLVLSIKNSDEWNKFQWWNNMKKYICFVHVNMTSKGRHEVEFRRRARRAFYSLEWNFMNSVQYCYFTNIIHLVWKKFLLIFFNDFSLLFMRVINLCINAIKWE